jgi:hypothetical protein
VPPQTTTGGGIGIQAPLLQVADDPQEARLPHCPLLLQTWYWSLPSVAQRFSFATHTLGARHGPHVDPVPLAAHCSTPHVEGVGLAVLHVVGAGGMQYSTSPTTQVQPAAPEAG